MRSVGLDLQPTGWPVCRTRIPSRVCLELGRFKEEKGTVFLCTGAVEVVTHASDLQPVQFSLGRPHKRSVVWCDFLVLQREPLAHGEERRLGVGCVLMAMSNVSVQVLRILFISKKCYRGTGGSGLVGHFVAR